MRSIFLVRLRLFLMVILYVCMRFCVGLYYDWLVVRLNF